MQIQKHKKQLALLLLIVLSLGATACPLLGKSDNKTRTLAKATDDFAEGQKSAAKLLADAKNKGTISQEDINEIKPFLLQANELNEEAIAYGKKLLATPDDQSMNNQLIEKINAISAVLVKANNAGLLRIKNLELRAAFSAIVVTLQAAVTSAVIVLKK